MKLLLTEKRDQANKLAAAMGWRQGSQCFTGTFEGEPITVVWASGHLVTLKDPDDVKSGLSWGNPASLVPLPQVYELKAGPQAKDKLANVKKHLSKATELIIATDSDREGEAIGWMIKDHLNFKGPVRRAWLAAGLDKKSLTTAMANLRDPSITKSWYRASEARGRSDWSYMMLVRAYTHFAGHSMMGDSLGRGDSPRERVTSVGRVQTPALSMIVKRETEIDEFKPQDYFKISGGFNGMKANYKPVVNSGNRHLPGIHWEESRATPKDGEERAVTPLYTDKAIIDQFKKDLLFNDQATVSQYKERLRSEAPPKTYSLTDAQSDIGKSLGISGSLVQTILEDLYEQGYLSYARTSKSELPINLYESSERNGVLRALSQVPDLKEASTQAAKIHNRKHADWPAFKPAVFVSKDMEHHGIIPTHQAINLNTISPRKAENGSVMHTREQMKKAYTMVAKRFIQALYPPAKIAVQDITLSVPVKDLHGNKTSDFYAKGEVVKDYGWRTAFGNANKKDVVFDVKKGDVIQLTSVDLRSAKTKCPERYNLTSFPKAMENVGRDVSDPKLRELLKNSEGIGTPATRKSVIKTLQDRQYISTKGEAIYASQKGRDLIKFTPAWLRSPEHTAQWEDKLVSLCGEKDDVKAIKMRDDFVKSNVDSIEKLINQMIKYYAPKMVNAKPNYQGTPKKVTPKMQKAIKSIAESKGIKLKRGVLSNPEMASAFFDEHASKDGIYPPSEKQVKFAESFLQGKETLPKDVLINRKICSEFIESGLKQKNEQSVGPR